MKSKIPTVNCIRIRETLITTIYLIDGKTIEEYHLPTLIATGIFTGFL